MSLRISLAAAAALVGLAALATPSFALQTITIPDPTAPAQADSAPDGLFDKSIPDAWQKKTDSNASQSGLSNFHFTMSSQSGSSMSGPQSAYDTSKQAGSEFYQPMPAYPDPFFAH